MTSRTTVALPALIPLESLEHASECLKTLAHPVRLRMVEMTLAGERTVGELAEACGVSPAAASEHLGLMKDRGLLASRRDGRRVFYSVAEPGLAGIIACVRSRFGPGASAAQEG